MGALTGMRSMAGLATLAAQHGGVLKPVMEIMAGGEMVADKTSWVGNRTDALPQAGRAVMGALAGGLIAHEAREAVWLGALVGAVTAVAATHLAYELRRRLPLSTTAGGLIEDAVVVAAGSLYARTAMPG
jgi:uncharacterized membrane protein